MVVSLGVDMAGYSSRLKQEIRTIEEMFLEHREKPTKKLNSG